MQIYEKKAKIEKQQQISIHTPSPAATVEGLNSDHHRSLASHQLIFEFRREQIEIFLVAHLTYV